MKNLNSSLLLGCCIISIGIIIAGVLVSNSIPPMISGNFSGSFISDGYDYSDYFDEYEAASFICMYEDNTDAIDIDSFRKLVGTGELDWTFTSINGNKVFSKEKLSLWLDIRVQESIKD